MKEKNSNNLNEIWINQGDNPLEIYCGDQVEYLRLFDKHFKNFSGSILEIGAGTGYLCKYIMRNYDVDYSILDIKKNIDELQLKYFSEEEFGKIKFTNSSEYTNVFKEEYDLFIATFVLPETPTYYWKDIFKNIKTNNCFMIDDGPVDDYENLRNQWAEDTFDSTDESEWIYTVTGHKSQGIQLTIGKAQSSK